MGMPCRHLITHFIEGPSMGPSSERVVEEFHGAVAVAGFSAAGVGSIVGSGNAWGLRWNTGVNLFL
jgi:hypothetical protein